MSASVTISPMFANIAAPNAFAKIKSIVPIVKAAVVLVVSFAMMYSNSVTPATSMCLGKASGGLCQPSSADT